MEKYKKTHVRPKFSYATLQKIDFLDGKDIFKFKSIKLLDKKIKDIFNEFGDYQVLMELDYFFEDGGNYGLVIACDDSTHEIFTKLANKFRKTLNDNKAIPVERDRAKKFFEFYDKYFPFGDIKLPSILGENRKWMPKKMNHFYLWK